jgi:hypothetical protein
MAEDLIVKVLWVSTAHQSTETGAGSDLQLTEGYSHIVGLPCQESPSWNACWRVLSMI